jgi:type VI secretion system protein ImpA
MKEKIDVDAILAPLPGDTPAGEDLRYSRVYEEIKEARKSDDVLDQGEWKRELKIADWKKVIALAGDALSHKTKDLQVAAWLNEALIAGEGFEGLSVGLAILRGLLDRYWDGLYPPADEGDLEFRAAPLEFLNEKLWSRIKEVPVTEAGYSWLQWQESRLVGYETDTLNRYGDVDENRKAQRDEYIGEGKITAEQFDAAVAQSSPRFYEDLAGSLSRCKDEFERLDEIVDKRFGSDAPRMTEFGQAIDECALLVSRICKERGISQAPKPESVPPLEKSETRPDGAGEETCSLRERPFQTRQTPLSPSAHRDDECELDEETLWKESLKILKDLGLEKALERLRQASLSAPSVREKSRYRLLIARLCLEAERPDLARPVVEEMSNLIDELHLDRWESPVWIAEVFDALYECLTRGEANDEDISRSKALLQKLCIMDITKAIRKKK